jgi:hypothetical protein
MKQAGTNKAGQQSRWAGWLNVPAWTANILAAATHTTDIHNNQGFSVMPISLFHKMSVYAMLPNLA